MKIKFRTIDAVRVVSDAYVRDAIEINGSMTERQLFDAMSLLWEHMEDSTLIEHFKLEGWDLKRLSSAGERSNDA